MDSQKKGFSLVLATAVISGFAIFINKFGVKGVDPYFYTFVKNVVAGTFLVSILFAFKGRKEIFNLKKGDKLKLILIGLIGGAIPFMLFFKGLSLTSAFKAGFIHKTLFIYVGFLAAFLLKEKISKSMLFGFLSLLTGSILFLKIKPQSFNIGDLYVFIAVLYWAVEIILSKKVLKNVSGTVVGSARLFIGSLFVLVYLFFTNKIHLIGGLNLDIISWSIISGFILAAYNFTFYNGLKYIKASEATAILTLGMPITGILTVIFLDGSLGGWQVVGIGLIVLGIILVSDFVKNIFDSKVKKVLIAEE